MRIAKRLRPLLLAVSVYAAYYGATVAFRNFILPPAQQSLIFLDDVLKKRIDVGVPHTVILGDSTAAFGYAAGLFPGTLSLAVFSGSFAEIHEAFDRYLNAFPAPRCVVLTASYNWAYHRDGKFWDIYALNGFYDWSELRELYETSARVGDFPASEHSLPGFLFKALLFRLRLQGVHLADVQDAIFKRSIYHGNLKFYSSMWENSGSINKSNTIFPFVGAPHEHLGQVFRPSALYDEYLDRIVRLAASRGIRLHWIQPPVSSRVLNDAARKHFEELNGHLRPIILSSPLNRFDGEPKVYPEDHFFSATHLNTRGARVFMMRNRELFEGCR